MSNPTITTMVERLQQEADAAVIEKRIATREEVLQTLTEFMHSGGAGDSTKLRAAELMGKHYGLFTDRIIAGPDQRSTEEIKRELEAKLMAWTGRALHGEGLGDKH